MSHCWMQVLATLSFVYSKVTFPLLRPTKQHPVSPEPGRKLAKAQQLCMPPPHTDVMSRLPHAGMNLLLVSATQVRFTTLHKDQHQHCGLPKLLEEKKWKKVNLPHLPGRMSACSTGQGMMQPRAVEKRRRCVSDHWMEHPRPLCSQTSP